MLKYSQIEAAIAQMHGVPERSMKTFRSRIRNFQRVGVVPSSPGKGQKIAYTADDALRWALCMELAAVGLSPATIVITTQLVAHTLKTTLAKKLQNDFFIHLTPDALGFSNDGGKSSIAFGFGNSRELASAAKHPSNRRMIVLNLRLMQEALFAALADLEVE